MIARRIVPSVSPLPLSPAQVAREFRRALDSGARIECAGAARRRPRRLLSLGYTPKYAIELFDAAFFLTGPHQNDDIRFFVAWVGLGGRDARCLYPRIFYKDVSLTWRSASHYARSDHENWIGKGDTKTVVADGETLEVSDEGTTDLPLEVQTALETLCRRARRFPRDEEAVRLILRRGGDQRIAPFADFSAPRRRARADRRNLVNGGRPVARFARRNDPTSLRFARGFEPDFGAGILEVSEATSRLYGGNLLRYRIASRNRRAQYLFIAAPRQVWIASCQATTTELSSYGVRTIDVVVDDDLLVPGYEYHFIDESADPPVLHSQIPPGFAGAVSELDPTRVDASPWLDQMPVIREFRARVLARGRKGSASWRAQPSGTGFPAMP